MTSYTYLPESDSAPTYFEWLPLYHEVAEELGIDVARDNLATYLVRRLLLERKVLDTQLPRMTPTTIVFGAGPSLERVLPRLADSIPRGLGLAAANGATKALLELGLVPTIVASDLDGGVEHLVEACRRGSTLFLHVHGDNIGLVLANIDALLGHCRLVVTTQVPRPPHPLVNLGGFTDGDRACIASFVLGARRLLLVGMDLCCPYVGRYSKGLEVRALRFKEVKLRIARLVLERLGRRIELFEVGSKCLTSSRCLSVEEARALVRNWLGQLYA